MKQIIFTIAFTFIVTAHSANAGWFTSDDSYKEQISKLEQQLQQQENSKNDWQLIAFVLGITSVVTLVGGAAIGSKGRRDANRQI